MGKRSGVPETDAAIAALSTEALRREIRSAELHLPHLGILPRKGLQKRLHRLYKALAEREG